jgi:hypothetical protein
VKKKKEKKKEKRRRGWEFGVPSRASFCRPPHTALKPSSLQALTSIPHWTSAFLWASIPLQELAQKHARTRQLGRLRLMTPLPMPLPSNRE